jgi:hypothetical protein
MFLDQFKDYWKVLRATNKEAETLEFCNIQTQLFHRNV